MKLKLPSLISPATRAFFRESRKAPKTSLLEFIHGYVYGRWTYFYISVGTGRHPLAKTVAPIATRLLDWLAMAGKQNGKQLSQAETFANTYHGKVLPLEAAKQLVMVQEEIRLPDLEHIIPYDRARAIILQNPQHIVALDCPCRVARETPCLPLDVCLIIGEPFAGFVTQHHPTRSRPITSQEAVEILKAEDERGHVHHAFFKDAMLGRFYAICNCCACCCGAMKAHSGGVPMLASSGYLAQVDETFCLACGACSSYCQFGALSYSDFGQAQVDEQRCMGCGVCLAHCPNDALSLVRTPAKGEPLEIFKLMQQAGRG